MSISVITKSHRLKDEYPLAALVTHWELMQKGNWSEVLQKVALKTKIPVIYLLLPLSLEPVEAIPCLVTPAFQQLYSHFPFPSALKSFPLLFPSPLFVVALFPSSFCINVNIFAFDSNQEPHV